MHSFQKHINSASYFLLAMPAEINFPVSELLLPIPQETATLPAALEVVLAMLMT